MLPDSDHNQDLAPDVLSGVLLNYQWRKIIVGVLEKELIRLAPVDTSESDMQTYQGRIDALIEDIYTVESPVMGYQIAQLNRTSDLALGAGATIITWQLGSNFDSGNPTRLIMPIEGRAIITAHIQITAGTVRSLVAQIIKNGGEVVGHYTAAADATTQRLTLTTQDSVFANDYFELSITTNAGSSFPASAEPQFFATVIGN